MQKEERGYEEPCNAAVKTKSKPNSYPSDLMHGLLSAHCVDEIHETYLPEHFSYQYFHCFEMKLQFM